MMTATERDLRNALVVLVLTPQIREFLLAHDPKALQQASNAIARSTP